jgi:hypothetical protein
VLRGVLEQGSEILFPRAQVIDAETRISREEFEWGLWTIAQILGWLAYPNESQFRSLEQADLIGRSYQGLTYSHDFINDKLEARLLELLLSSRIKGYQDGKEIGVGEFTKIRTVWDLSDVMFVRSDVLSNEIMNRDTKAALLGHKPGVNDPSPAESLSPSFPGKRGRRPEKRNRIRNQMLDQINSGRLKLDQLKTATEESLVEDYKASRETVNAARKAVLLELSAILIPTNSD